MLFEKFSNTAGIRWGRMGRKRRSNSWGIEVSRCPVTDLLFLVLLVRYVALSGALVAFPSGCDVGVTNANPPPPTNPNKNPKQKKQPNFDLAFIHVDSHCDLYDDPEWIWKKSFICHDPKIFPDNTYIKSS